MYHPTYAYLPSITEPTPQERFRRELADERKAAAAHEADEVNQTPDSDLMVARHLQRAARYVTFS